MKIWICIPVHNRIEYTIKCLESLQVQSFKDVDVVVCDDGSTDGTGNRIKAEFPDVKVVKGDGDLWWTGGINKCVEYALKEAADDDAILTLNNDLSLPSDYLEEIASVFSRYEKVIVASSIYDIRTDRLYDPGAVFKWTTATSKPINQKRDHYNGDRDVALVSHAPGRGTLIPVRAFREIGLYDQKNLPHYGADYDFTFRAAKKGYRILVAYRAKIYSHVHETGLTGIRERLTIMNAFDYFASRKSPANLKNRFLLAVKNCPKHLLPSYLLIDLLRLTGSFMKFHVFGLSSRNRT